MNISDGFWPVDSSVGEVVYPPGGKFGPRQQMYLQLVLIHTGSAKVWIDGVEYEAPANSVFLLYPGHEECFEFSRECETWHTYLHATIPHLDPRLCERLERLEWYLPLSPAMNQLIRDALNIRASTFPTRVELLNALVAQMLWRYLGEGEQRMTQSTEAALPAVEQAQQFIHDHLNEQITLDDIAASVAVSPAHLIRLFRAQLRTTPISYLWQSRVARGIELLEQTGLTVGTIAERCGFQSRFHFSRRVREATEMTPLEIRQKSWRRT